MEQRKRGAVTRYGRGLNSFTVRTKPERRQTFVKPMFEADDPNRYRVQGMVAGEFQVIDRNNGTPVATQLETRAEADAWIAEKVKA